MARSKRPRSVLPRVKADVTGDVARLTDSGDKRGFVLLFFLLPLLFFGFSAALVYAWWLEDEWFILGFAALLFIPGVLVAWRVLREWRVVSTFEPAVLQVQPWPIRLGETVSLRYSRAPRTAVDPRYVVATVEVEEEASYTVGTETRTVTHTVWKKTLDRQMVSGSNSIEPVHAEWSLAIPADRPASFDASNNEIDWEVTATLHYGQGNSDDSSFTLLVLPELAAEVGTP